MATNHMLRACTASAILFILAGCTNDPQKVSTNTSNVKYDHSERKKVADKQYVNRYEKAFIKAHNSKYPADKKSAAQPKIQLASYSPSQKRNLQHKQRQYPIHSAWRHLHQGFKFRNYNHQPKVRRYVNSYAKMPQRMQTLSNRSAPYLPTIMHEIRRRNMPSEIALLPFVESAFNQNAYSPAHAAGLWQFIPGTARRYGLNVNSRHDERYNWKSSTHAALNYLQDLNRQFNGDWLLSLAAYNCGEGRVHREIAKNKARGLPTDYWHLNLPKETRNYVPRLLAFKEIYGSPGTYNMNIAHIPANPGFARTQYKPSATAYTKVASRKAYKSKKNKTSKKSRKKIITHKVRSGDTLYRIARRYGTSINKIMSMNGLKSTRINPGKRLKVATLKSKRHYG